MVHVQLLTDMRTDEVCAMGECKVGQCGRGWISSPKQHKWAHRNEVRVIQIGPRPQEMLVSYRGVDLNAHVFKPEHLSRS